MGGVPARFSLGPPISNQPEWSAEVLVFTRAVSDGGFDAFW